MRRAAMGAALILGMLWTRPALASAPTWALPHGARLLGSSPIPGDPGAFALAYSKGHDYLAVALARGRGQLIWNHEVGGSPSHLDTPGPPGIFRAEVSRPSGGEALFAFEYHARSVVSAIADVRPGYVTGDEGVRLAPGGFTTLNLDVRHLGSVRYRFETSYDWQAGAYRETARVRVPDYSPNAYPAPNGVIRTPNGNVTLIRLRIADTEALREAGLMNVKHLDPDSGMVFAWPSLTHDSFWMQSTYIPLSVAFLAPDGRIQEIQDMAPLSTTLHTPQLPYRYAIEVNQGFFARNGILPGDLVELHLRKGST